MSHQRHSQVLAQSPPQSQPSSQTITPVTGAQLHKLLVSGGTMSTPTNLNYCSNRLMHTNNSPIPVTTTTHSELSRLPGGAELNILTPTSHNATMYRQQGKFIVNSNSIFKCKIALSFNLL